MHLGPCCRAGALQATESGVAAAKDIIGSGLIITPSLKDLNRMHQHRFAISDRETQESPGIMDIPRPVLPCADQNEVEGNQ